MHRRTLPPEHTARDVSALGVVSGNTQIVLCGKLRILEVNQGVTFVAGLSRPPREFILRDHFILVSVATNYCA